MAYGKANIDTIQSSTAGTPPQFNDGNGTQTGTLCRAWVNFNGTGTVAIRASFNVSSITDRGTGQYTINFTTALPDANYSLVGTHSSVSGDVSSLFTSNSGYGGVNSTTAATINTSVGGGFADPAYVNISVFR